MQIRVKTLVNLLPLNKISYVSMVNVEENALIIGVKLENLNFVLNFLNNSIFFKAVVLTDIVCVDNLSSINRFSLIYCLRSVESNTKFYVYTTAKIDESVASSTNIFLSANWLEREIWDMYGVFFAEHPDLRRLLTDYGFDGHPLRKDFPLSGYVELRYDDEIKKILIEPLSLSQEFRYFDFTSPWDNQRQ